MLLQGEPSSHAAVALSSLLCCHRHLGYSFSAESRSGCDGVTCWDGACPCHCLPVMERLAHGAFVSTVPAAFHCTDFWRLLSPCSPRFHGRLVEGAAPGCYLHHAGAELLVGWGWAWMDPSLPLPGQADTGSFSKGGFWSDCCLPG